MRAGLACVTSAWCVAGLGALPITPAVSSAAVDEPAVAHHAGACPRGPCRQPSALADTGVMRLQVRQLPARRLSASAGIHLSPAATSLLYNCCRLTRHRHPSACNSSGQATLWRGNGLTSAMQQLHTAAALAAPATAQQAPERASGDAAALAVAANSSDSQLQAASSGSNGMLSR